jgi:hypothetical protein
MDLPGTLRSQVLIGKRFDSTHKKRRYQERLFCTADLLQTNLTQFGLFPATNRDALGLGLFRNHAQQVDA